MEERQQEIVGVKNGRCEDAWDDAQQSDRKQDRHRHQMMEAAEPTLASVNGNMSEATCGKKSSKKKEEGLLIEKETDTRERFLKANCFR